VGKKQFLLKEMGQGSMNIMKKIKDAFDPSGILNPNKILDSKNAKSG